MDIFQFLEQKGQNYKDITINVAKIAFNKIKPLIKLPFIIHLVGTNGKGSTGRFISSIIHQNKKNILHYTSPHIFKVNERIWINGDDISDDKLNNAHKKLYNILGDDLSNKLTYFEYLTLLAIYLSDGFDYLVLEAGLGGEFDATSVVENDLSVIPTIGLDHIEFLGDNLIDIATTKLKSVNKAYIFGKNMPKEVFEVEKNILKDKKKITLKDIKLPKNNYPIFLKDNLLLALNVIDYLKLDYENIFLPTLKGRMEKIDNIIVDVGHNELAANVIKQEIKNKINLVYNTYKDKDYQKILTILKPIIKQILIIDIDDDRIVEKEKLFKVAKELNIKIKEFDYDIKKDEQYLVFGSFKVVEKFFEK